jgi:hypothetical protein
VTATSLQLLPSDCNCLGVILLQELIQCEITKGLETDARLPNSKSSATLISYNYQFITIAGAVVSYTEFDQLRFYDPIYVAHVTLNQQQADPAVYYQ